MAPNAPSEYPHLDRFHGYVCWVRSDIRELYDPIIRPEIGENGELYRLGKWGGKTVVRLLQREGDDPRQLDDNIARLLLKRVADHDRMEGKAAKQARQPPTPAVQHVAHAPTPPFTGPARQPPTVALPNVTPVPIPPFTTQATPPLAAPPRVAFPPVTPPFIPPALTRVPIPTTRWLDAEAPLRALGYTQIQWGMEGGPPDLQPGEFYRVLYVNGAPSVRQRSSNFKDIHWIDFRLADALYQLARPNEPAQTPWEMWRNEGLQFAEHMTWREMPVVWR